MAEIFPFRAWRYDPRRVRLADVVTQPYDKITPEMQRRYLEASPWNFIRVEKGESRSGDSERDNVYTRAAGTLNGWIRQGVLINDARPSIYLYFQEYTVPGATVRKTRKGFIALGRLEDYSASVVFRHEHTLPGPKADRLDLLRHTITQTGLLFLLYEDPERLTDKIIEQAAREQPLVEVADEYGVIHRLWAVSDPDVTGSLTGALAPRPLAIADGHHRYETALAFRDECRRAAAAAGTVSVGRDAPYEKAMMALFNSHSEGLTILPTHRLVSGLDNFDFGEFLRCMEEQFDRYSYPFAEVTERASAVAEFRRDLEWRGRSRHAIGVYAGGTHSGGAAFYLFLLRNGAEFDPRLRNLSTAERKLDVVLLYRLVLERCLGITSEDVAGEDRVGYERAFDAALAAVDSGRAQLALLMNAARIEQVTEVAFSGQVMPEKSTDFYPKLLSGLALYRLKS